MFRLLDLLSIACFCLACLTAAYFGYINLTFPVEAGYEAPCMLAVEDLKNGINIYSPENYASSPFRLVIYTPLYFYICAILPDLNSLQYTSGRLVSFMSSLCIFLVLCRLIPNQQKNDRLMLSLFPLVIFNMVYIENLVVFRPDMFGILISVLGFLICWRFYDTNWACLFIPLFLVLSFYCKQSLISSTLAFLLFYFLHGHTKKGFTMAFLCLLALSGAVSLGVLEWGDGFWFSITNVMSHPRSLEHALRVLSLTSHNWGLLLILFGALTSVVYTLLSDKNLLKTPVTYYFTTTCILSFIMIPKLGASENYFLEPVFSACILLIFVSRKYEWTSIPLIRIVCLVAVGIGIAGFIREYKSIKSLADPRGHEYTRTLFTYLSSTVTDSNLENRPLLCFIYPHVLSHSFDVEPNDALMVSKLWASGVLNMEPLIDNLRNKRYGHIIVTSGWIERNFDERASVLIRAIQKNYYLQERLHGINVLRPKL